MKYAETIILLTPGFPSSEQDTTCLPFLQDWVLDFGKLFPEKRLYIIAFQYPFKKGVYLWNGVEVYSAGGKNTNGLKRLFTWLRVIRAFYRTRNKSTGIISLWLNECTLVGQWLHKISGVGQLAYLIGQDSDPKNKYLKLINLKKLKIAAVSKQVGERLNKNTGTKVNQIIPLGIRDEKSRIEIIEKKNIDILGVGSMIPLKNYAVFIKIIARLKADYPGITAVLIGDGPELANLKDIAEKYNVNNVLSFTGAMSNSEVLDYMRKSRILLHPSFTEGQATVFTEALACGMRIACFDVGRIDAEGRLFIAKDEEDLFVITKTLFNDSTIVAPIVMKNMKETVYEGVELLNKEI